MAKRVELNAQDLESVVGGAFKFYNIGDEGYCKVTEVQNAGTYRCKPGAIHDFLDMRAETPGLSGDEYLQMALDQGILW